VLKTSKKILASVVLRGVVNAKKTGYHCKKRRIVTASETKQSFHPVYRLPACRPPVRLDEPFGQG